MQPFFIDVKFGLHLRIIMVYIKKVKQKGLYLNPAYSNLILSANYQPHLYR